MRLKNVILNHVKKYILRSKIQIENVDDQYDIYHAWGPNVNSNLFIKEELPKGEPTILPDVISTIGYVDPRHSSLGFRFIKAKNHSGIFPIDLFSWISFEL
jgi:folate-binding Fe-S cluster repair protein YgfZ